MALGEKGRIEPGAVTLIQRFGGSINPNIHWLSSRALASAVSREATFHMLVLEGVYAVGGEQPRWVGIAAPTDEEIRAVIKTLSIRILRYLTRHGYFENKGEGLEEGADLFSGQEPVLATCMAASGFHHEL